MAVSTPVVFFGISVATWITVALAIVAGNGAKSIGDPRPTRAIADHALLPSEVACLNGGPQLAVLSALSELARHDLIISSGGTVSASVRQHADLDALARAVLGAVAAAPDARESLAMRPEVAAVLAVIENRLVDAGLLLSDRRRLLIRMIGFLVLGAAAILLLTTVTQVATTVARGGLPTSLFDLVFLLVPYFFVFVVASIGLRLVRVPRRSVGGGRTLAALRDRHHELAPTLHRSGADLGVTGAALGVGLYGAESLWTCDPGLADALCVPAGDGGGMVGGRDGSSDSSS